MIDLVFPKNNEKEFVRIAEKLGIKNICFVYSLKDFEQRTKVNTKINIYSGLLVNPSELRRVRKPVDLIICRAQDDNRVVLENRAVDMVFGLENHSHKDFLHHRNSGLNQVLAVIAGQNRKVIAMDFNSVLNSEPAQCARILGRMMQNAMLCRKYKADIAVASFATEPYEMRGQKELEAFARILGITDAKGALTAISSKILENQKRRSPGYIAEGIEEIS